MTASPTSMPATTTARKSPQSSPTPGGPKPERDIHMPGELAFTILLASLWSMAGHSVLLGHALFRLYRIPSPVDLGGFGMVAIVGWLLLTLPLGIAAVLLRRYLLRLPRTGLAALATLACLLSVAAFCAYSIQLAP